MRYKAKTQYPTLNFIVPLAIFIVWSKTEKEVNWMMTKKRRVSQIKSIQAPHPTPCPVVSKNGGELVQRWLSSKFLCFNQTRKEDFVSSFSIFSWILVIHRPQPSGWLEGGDKSRRHDESSFWYAGLKICWRNCVTFKLEFMWIVDQAKESDPEHSVKVSGLAYIALVALHRSDVPPTPSYFCARINLIEPYSHAPHSY